MACVHKWELAFLDVRWALFTPRKQDDYFMWHMLGFLFFNMEAQTTNQ